MSNIFLIGFMGAGKTTIGFLLAKKLNFNFEDTDQMIVQEECKEIVEIFESKGEDYFRDLETKKLLEIEDYKKTIFATGGGIVLRQQNREILKRNFSVYLKASYQTIFERIKDDNTRPLLNTQDPYSTGLKIFESREDIYDSFDFIVDTDNVSPALIVDEIYSLYKKQK
ncbi:shikimate kinase [bacterium]|jgi:shikimate kinase|nr:shikimate kinase [bacterium]MBT3795500.1 shikimate kinase [bacterium]MBT4634834.1 shikimate kinase [bacterium]